MNQTPMMEKLPAACRALLQRVALASLLAFFAANTASAMDKPAGKVILTISGKVSKPNQGKLAQFDLRMLEALPQVSHTVTTPWYPRKVTFRGPLLRDVLNAAGGSGTRIKAIAINDYAVEIPLSDALQHEVILALRLNGKPMAARDKGPIFVIYPYDKFAPDAVQRFYDRSVWQLDTLQLD
ncbi:molybdopterin-dependent oxidoreductase [Chitinibacter sp. FCG-7]|uniref:Molybdopterin-dependent oxidoreductase n=1 Tax=Chitinibacter mangrovi TaxID=3153927 RepID=A0AAU7F8F7_9NEIS